MRKAAKKKINRLHPVCRIAEQVSSSSIKINLARMFHELQSRDHEDARATWQPQGVGPESYLNGTSQGPTAEDARKDGYIRGRSR
jgi:hypothetical protein